MDNIPSLEDSNPTNLDEIEVESTKKITSLEKKKGLPKGVSGNLAGRGLHLRKVEEFEELVHAEQHAYLRDLWKSIAVGVAHRARYFSSTCAPKDFSKLYQLVQTGAVALDRAFPPKQELQTPKLIFNLFNSLGQRATRIAVPETPVIDVQATQLSVSETVQPVTDEVQSESRSSVTTDSGSDRSTKDP